MALLRGELKRGFLRQIVTNANSASVNLSDALNAFQATCFAAVSGGRLIASDSANGQAVSFKVPANNFTEDTIMELSEEFQAVYADALTTLATAGTSIPQNPKDANNLLFNTMMADDRLQSITDRRTDYTSTRFPSFGAGGAQ
jgi:hypothetical protein